MVNQISFTDFSSSHRLDDSRSPIVLLLPHWSTTEPRFITSKWKEKETIRWSSSSFFVKGFQAHGTKTSDDFRKLIALFRETQTNHLYPHTPNSKVITIRLSLSVLSQCFSSFVIQPFQQIPYASYQAHINPCSKRFYLPSCPISKRLFFHRVLCSFSHSFIYGIDICFP